MYTSLTDAFSGGIDNRLKRYLSRESQQWIMRISLKRIRYYNLLAAILFMSDLVPRVRFPYVMGFNYWSFKDYGYHK